MLTYRHPESLFPLRESGPPQYEALFTPNHTANAPSVSSFASSKSSAQFSFASSDISKRSSVTSNGSGLSFGYAFEARPTLVKTPWELERSKHHGPTRIGLTAGFAARYFKTLPQEVYDCILRQLEKSHHSRSEGVCATCYLRDLQSLMLTSRTWYNAAKTTMYKKICLPVENPPSPKKLKAGTQPGRLKLLRRTLRERPALSRLTKEITLYGWQQHYEKSLLSERQFILDNVASLVMACPNLERLVGLYLVHDHNFNRLTYALSTRKKLMEHSWVIRDTRLPLPEGEGSDDEEYQEDLARYVRESNIESFLQYHNNWPMLHTLFLHGNGAGHMNFRSFVGTFRKLPMLKHLLIANFGAVEFNDRTLAALPKLFSLRLQDLPGVTDRGLLRLAGSDSAKYLRQLSLMDLEVVSSVILIKFLENSRSLRKLTLVQYASPVLPVGTAIQQPLYASSTLEHLHWDVLLPGPANEDIASSIKAGGFPSLRTIRAPCDHDGMLQALCRPNAEMTLLSDHHLIKFRNHPDRRVTGNSSNNNSSARLIRSLPFARRAAQQRLEAAQQLPGMKIVVEEEAVLQRTYTLRSYMGKLDSKIEYTLEPDVKGSDDAIASLKDLVGASSGQRIENMCSGMQNVAGLYKGESVKCHDLKQKVRTVPLRRFF